MAVIYYKKHAFHPPAPISNNQYQHFKREIMGNPHFQISGDANNTFLSTYKSTFRRLLIGLTICFGGMLVYSIFFDFVKGQFGLPEWLAGICIVVGGFMAFVMLMSLLLEGPSMATTLTDQKVYFSRMRHTIRHYPDYSTFYQAFYNSFGKDAPFMREAVVEHRKLQQPADRFFTRAFYIIDRHWWKVVLVGVAVVLVKKYVMK